MSSPVTVNGDFAMIGTSLMPGPSGPVGPVAPVGPTIAAPDIPVGPIGPVGPPWNAEANTLTFCEPVSNAMSTTGISNESLYETMANSDIFLSVILNLYISLIYGSYHPHL